MDTARDSLYGSAQVRAGTHGADSWRNSSIAYCITADRAWNMGDTLGVLTLNAAIYLRIPAWDQKKYFQKSSKRR